MSYDDRSPDGATLPEYRGAFTSRACPECGARIMGWRVRCDDCDAPTRDDSPDSDSDDGREA